MTHCSVLLLSLHIYAINVIVLGLGLFAKSEREEIVRSDILLG
jgi:hypothetical protein